MIYPIQNKYPMFFDFDGKLLNNGFIYIGEENRNPIKYPVVTYSDKNYLNEFEQPIRTNNGFALYNGKKSLIFTSIEPFSLLICNDNMEKIHYNPSITEFHPNVSNRNYIVNGDFRLFGIYYPNSTIGIDPANIYYYKAEGTQFDANSTYQWSNRDFDIGDEKNIKYLQFNAISGAASNPQQSYIKMLQTLEDIYEYNDKELTISFYYKTDNTEFFKNASISVSLVQFSSQTYVFSDKFSMKDYWVKYEKNFKFPKLDSGTISAPYPDEYDNGLVITFWPYAGTDYLGETNFLENINTNAIYSFQIANLKLEFGNKATDYVNEPFEFVLNRWQRRIETTLDRNGYPILGNQKGYITYISPGIQSYIPGFRFKQRKRTRYSTVRIYSYATKNEGFVTLVGIGEVAVTSVNDIDYNGCGTITLASNTAAGNVYKYHYIVEDEFTL